MKASSTRASNKAGPSISKRQTNGRLPQAPSSLLVQLPPDELQKFRDSAIQGGNITGSLVQASDVHLLANSIQQRRERETRIFIWQQRLIDADETFSRDDLKRALTQLSLSSWLQVLQERHLDGRCAYPGCSRKPKKPHISSRKTILPLDAPRYRISLGSQSIRRDERDDPGGENGYCSKVCWRRGEWISRWVLQGFSAQKTEREKRKGGAHLKSEGVSGEKEQGLGSEVNEGGRWESQIEEEHWAQIEILEDLEDKGEIELLADDERRKKVGSTTEQTMALEDGMSELLKSGAADDGEIKVVPTKSDLDQFSSMLNSLTIIERGKQTKEPILVQETSFAIQPQSKHTIATRSVSITNNTQRENNGEVIEDAAAMLSDADSDDLDVLGELSLRGEAGDNVVSTILQSSRHLQRDDDNVDDDARSHEMTEEELRDLQEQDDLFALAWQAREEEKAKGNWHN